MNPEEIALLKRSLEVSEENNRILRGMQKTARIAFIWGFIKLLIVIVPLVVGYVYLEPFIKTFIENLNTIGDFVPVLNTVLPR